MNWRIAILVALAAAPGSVAIAWLALPLLVDPSSLQIPIETLQLAAAAQSLVLVVVASFVGAQLGARVGLRAPAVSAIACGGGFLSALRPQISAGVAGGLLGAAVIVGFIAFSPSELAAIQTRVSIPLVARLLYGGITEEVLIRWGLMTFLVWTGWRVFQRGAGQPSARIVWLAVVLSALLFGVSHVPAVAAAMGSVSAPIIVYVTLGNALFGVVAGYLYWRFGLEAAITAHVVAHALAYLVHG